METKSTGIVEQHEGLPNVPATKEELHGLVSLQGVLLVFMFTLAGVLFYRLFRKPITPK